MQTDSSPGSPVPAATPASPTRVTLAGPRVDIAVVVALGVLLTGMVFAPGAASWVDHFVGDGGVDAQGTQWFYWLLGRRTLTGEPFAHTDLLFYPWGKDVYLHTGGNVLDAALALPFRFILGPTVGYDVYVVALLVANGAAAVRLARGLGAGVVGAGLSAVLFGLNPFVLGEVAGGRPTQALLAFSCLFISAWVRLIDGVGSRSTAIRRAAAAGLWLGLSGLAYWFYAIFGVVIAVAAALPRVIRPVGGDTRLALVGRLALSGVVAAAIALPLAWPMIAALAQGAVPGLLDVGAWTLGSWAPTTVEGWKVGVEAFDLLSGDVGFHADLGSGPAFFPKQPGVFVIDLLLLVVGLHAAPRRYRVALLSMVLTGVLLSIGPSLDHRAGLTNPFYIAASWVLPPLQRLWWPSRALGLVHVALVPVVALGIDRLGGDGRVRRLFVGVAVVAAAGVELERSGLAPMVTSSADVPQAYHCLAEQQGAILELPYGGRPEQLLYQAVHRRPRFGGMLEDNPVFAPSEHVAFRDANRFVQALFAVAEGAPIVAEPSVADREAVHDLGIAYVVVETQQVGARTDPRGRKGALRRAHKDLSDLLGQPVFVDDQTMVFAPWGAPWRCSSD